MDPVLATWMEKSERARRFDRIQRSLFFGVVGLFALSGVALPALTGRPLAPLLSGTLDLGRGLDRDKTILIVPDPPPPPPTAPGGPPYETLTLGEETGSEITLLFSRLNALAMNRQGTVIAGQFGEYLFEVEGQNLGPLYDDIRMRRIEKLPASSLASGGTFVLPVEIERLDGHPAYFTPDEYSLRHGAPAESDAPATGPSEPVIERIRLLLDHPFHFSPDGTLVPEQ